LSIPHPEIFLPVFNAYLPEPHSSLLSGIIFGTNLKTSKEFYESLRTVGLLHIVVLSGINITLLTVIISSLTKNLGKLVSILITILSIIFFVIFVGPEAPIIRAAIMGLLTSVAILYGRKYFVIYSLILSIIFIGIFFPLWLTTISLWLSYGATFGIILFGRSSSKWSVCKDLRVSLAAQIFTTPIIFIYFKQVSIIAPISNLFVSGIIAPLMIFGFLTAILGKINYFLGYIPSLICYGLLSYLIFVVETLSKLPFIFFKF